MIGTRLQIIILVGLLVVLTFMVVHIRRKKLDFRLCLPWLFLILVCIILTCFPKLLDMIAGLIGIAAPVNMLFLCGFGISLLIIYILTVAVSKLTANVFTLTQKVALLEKELKESKK